MEDEDFPSRLHVVRYVDETLKSKGLNVYMIYNLRTGSERVFKGSIEKVIDLLFKKGADYEITIPALKKSFYSTTVEIGILRDILSLMKKEDIKWQKN